MAANIAVDDFIQFAKRNVVGCTLFTITILCLFIVNKLFTNRKNLPPGPFCLPVVGYLPFLGKTPHIKLDELRKKYGDVFGLYLGQRYVVILTGRDAIKEAFSKSEFLGRPTDSISRLFKVNKAMPVINGKVWEEQRRFMLHLLRDLGFGKSRMEQHIQEEIHYFIRQTEKEGNNINLIKLLTPSVSNNITSLVFGERLNYDNPRRIYLDNTLDEFAKFTENFFAVMFFPCLYSVLEILGFNYYKRFVKMVDGIDDYVKREIKEHEATLDETNIKDYIDGYIVQMREDQKQKKSSSFDEEMLCGNVRALFGAGSGTVRSSLDWTFLILACFPEVQRRIREEVSDVIGGERDPCWSDRLKMPYTQAFTMEVQRWRTIVPLNLVRCASVDTTVQGFHIPKGAVVLANFWSVHNNPEYWDEPEEFRPERFLNEEKTGVIKHEALMPFSIGKRSCPGEIFAKIEIFLYLTSILQHYNISLPEGQKNDLSSTSGFTNDPKPWEACFKKIK